MSSPLKVLTIVGARPQFIKAAAVSRAIRANPDVQEAMVHTGQHFDAEMSDVFFDELGIPAPDHNLAINRGPHGQMTGRMLEAVESTIQSEDPHWVLVYGDTNSTLAGALAAAKLHVPVAHIEAGLRSYNRRMPEEINRVLTDHLSTLLLCPTRQAVTNLAAEGIRAGVHLTGDVMYDASLHALADHRSDITTRLGLQAGAYAVVTIHRAENTDDRHRLVALLDYLLANADGQKLIFPIHPRTREAVARYGLSLEGFQTLPPIGYLDMARLVSDASVVYTDSGGLQKEAYFHRTPCVTLRSETEWVETVEAGWNRLWQVPKFRPRREIEEYGDGQAAERIVSLLHGYDNQ